MATHSATTTPNSPNQPLNGTLGNSAVSSTTPTANPDDIIKFLWNPASQHWAGDNEITQISAYAFSYSTSGNTTSGSVTNSDIFTSANGSPAVGSSSSITGLQFTLKNAAALSGAFGLPYDPNAVPMSHITVTVKYMIFFNKTADPSYTWMVDPEVDVVVPCG